MMLVEPRFRYRMGARVRVCCVDMESWCGRDLHPDVEDKGQLGYVIAPTTRCPLLDGTGANNTFYLVSLVGTTDDDMTIFENGLRSALIDLEGLKWLIQRRTLEFVDYELEPA